MNTIRINSSMTELLGFPFRGGTHFFHPEQIIRLQAESNYTFIYTREHKPIIMAKVLADYEDLLAPFGFVRIHRSHLVNRQHIHAVRKDGRIVMDDMSEAAISRRKRRDVLKNLSC